MPILKLHKNIEGLLLLLLIGAFFHPTAWCESDMSDRPRYFCHGDGKIHLKSEKNGRVFEGVYRTGSGAYDPKSVGRICRLFDAPYEPGRPGISLRLLEYLDFLQDRVSPEALITIISGYRSPEYNKGIRNRGGLAAKASLHQYGMACDVKIAGVPAKKLWDYIKEKQFGGTGYYHGESVHIDVGPARFWDETTSGVGTGISDGNKLIGMVTDYDIYRPGMPVILRFIRMTGFPISVDRAFSLIPQSKPATESGTIIFIPEFSIPSTEHCPKFSSIDQMDRILWHLPPDIQPGRYTIQAGFCGDAWPDMPREIQTPEFEIKSLHR